MDQEFELVIGGKSANVALIDAAENGNLAMVEFLLDKRDGGERANIHAREDAARL